MSDLIKLARRIEAVVKGNNIHTLLHNAMAANKGHGINVHYNKQHFGWFLWSTKNKKHEEFTIANFKDKDTVGKLEDVVAKLKNVNLEDYK